MSKLYTTRFRLYRSQLLQVIFCREALDEIYKVYMLSTAQTSKVQQIFVEFLSDFAGHNFAKFAKIIKFANFASFEPNSSKFVGKIPEFRETSRFSSETTQMFVKSLEIMHKFAFLKTD